MTEQPSILDDPAVVRDLVAIVLRDVDWNAVLAKYYEQQAQRRRERLKLVVSNPPMEIF